MRFSSHVTHHSTKPNDGDEFTVVPIEAASDYEAATRIAEIAARRRFGPTGFSSGVTRRNDQVFLASIGEFRRERSNGFTHGVAISIRLRGVE